jgi:hypothetical protein
MTGDLKTFGPITVARHIELQAAGVHLHVFHNGVDVTRRCEFADDTPGRNTATLFKLDAQGRKYLDPATQRVAREVIHGIEIREGEPLS